MSEVRALLLTDVVDSTSLSGSIGDAAMAKVWAAHDRAARDLLGAWRGREIDKSDGMLVLFGTATDAVGYALAYHRAIAALDVPLQARVGLHVGPVDLRENSAADIALGAKPLEVDGIAKPTAARVMSVAQGGQTLLTADARSALGDSGVRACSHGHWRLKGVAEPIELFEVAEDAASPLVPPVDGEKAYRVVRQGDLWLPAKQVRHSLPAELDAFVGRTEQILDLAQRLESGARIVSIIGTGGSGKTRLVTRFAWTVMGDFPGGSWFCDLAAARSVDGIAHAVGRALDVPLGKEDPIVQLGNAIAGHGRCLVILDNFEQVARHAEETLGRWLSRAVDARFVVTTREVLGLPGEQVLALPPLPQRDSATLFVQRARAAKQEFEPTAGDAAAIAELAKLLDGLPLAIELAAARMRVMSPQSLVERMSERFKLLASTGRRQDRQATLRATFDWSWDLLSAADKSTLAQLSVFESGFTLESAEAVVDLKACDDAPWVADTVQSLVDKSLVRQLRGGRFDLLPSLQEYAWLHLRSEGRFPGSGPAAQGVTEERHYAHFGGFDAERAIADRGADTDNLVTACVRAAAQGASVHAAGALRGAWAALKLRGPYRVGVELASIVGSIPGLDAAVCAGVDEIAGDAFGLSGNVTEARERLDGALALARQVGDRRCEARVRSRLGFLDLNAGNFDGTRAHYEAALALATSDEVRDGIVEWEAYNGLGNAWETQGRFELSRPQFEAALQTARRLGDRRREGRTLGNLGILHVEQGKFAEGRALYEAALGRAREMGDRQWEGNTLSNLGLLHQLEGRSADAMATLEAALAVARELGNVRGEGIVLCNLGIVLDAAGRFDDARNRLEEALAKARSIGDQRSEGQFLGYLALAHAHQHRFDEARRCLESGETLLRAVSDLFSLGILQCGRAETEQLAGAVESAKVALDEAQSLALEVGAGPQSELGQAIERARRVGAAT
jgi:predicted ATPase/class 3 adenylate cyclase/tetratricopeptide (TPR) repeat protein